MSQDKTPELADIPDVVRNKLTMLAVAGSALDGLEDLIESRSWFRIAFTDYGKATQCANTVKVYLDIAKDLEALEIWFEDFRSFTAHQTLVEFVRQYDSGKREFKRLVKAVRSEIERVQVLYQSSLDESAQRSERKQLEAIWEELPQPMIE